MRNDAIKGFHDGLLLLFTPVFANCCDMTYIIADARSRSITAYGPCPWSALEAMGRDGTPGTFEECVHRVVLAADNGYYLDNGHGIPMLEVSESWHTPDEISRFFSAETAALAAAVAGWPEPITLFGQN